MIKLVAFDLDGTIGNTLPLCIAAFKKAVAPCTGNGLTEKEIIRTFGLNEEGMIKQLVAGDLWRKALADFYEVYEKMHGMCPRPFDGIRELIGELKEKSVGIALVTGKGEKSCAISLRQFKMESCFDSIKTGSSEKNNKPENIRDLLAAYRLQPQEMLYIGDAVSDIEACRKVDVRCLSAAWAPEVADVSRLEECNKTNVFYSVESLRDFFREQSAGGGR